MEDAQNDSTRVFVKGLPPSLTSEELSSHFGKQFKVSDAHVLADRRIGFVGFHDNESAQKAVKYFNRSYIRMSKISVDLARPVEVKRDAAGQAVPVSKRNTLHPTRPRNVTNESTHQTKDGSLKKRKRDVQDDGEKERVPEETEDKTIQSTKDDEDEEHDPEESKLSEEVAPARSDDDWLRGKTSRLLDLLEPEEITDPATSTGDKPRSKDTLPGEVEPEGDKLELSNSKDDEAEEVQTVPNGRLFIRNLAFDVTDADLEDRFARFGKLQEAHIVKDARKSTSKGLAFLQFSEPEAAEKALKSLDGVSFHGRLLHILPASDKREQGLTDFEISKMPLKKQKALKRKMEASKATFSWNSLYMNPDAVISSIADRLGVTKAEILDPTSADAAIKQALAETQLIAETKEFLRSQGVSIDAFKNKIRDNRILLLKNFPFNTSESDLRALLDPFGEISRFIIPPAGTMALVQFAEPYSASQALKQLAYKNVKGSVLYLEKAPRGLLSEQNVPIATVHVTNDMTSSIITSGDSQATANATTLFVRNLNFATTTARLTEVFRSIPGFMSARVKTRVDPKRPGEVLSMGFGFIEFRNKASADAAITTLNGHRLDGHDLIVQRSSKSSDLAEERRKDDIAHKSEANKTKIIIKNLPFEASKKDIRSLFGQYGQLKTVRMPKKFDNSSRGFGFAEFVTPKEAQNAMDALSDTHLLGRRLVLEFTEEEEIDPEEQIQAMERKMNQQSNRIELSKLTGSGRKKFVLGMNEDE